MAEEKAVQTIQDEYADGTATVPYATFMKCFNRLVKDQSTMEPAEPSDELYPYFEATCMAIDLGIRDDQGRDEDRRREFYDYIYPIWQKELPSGKFHTVDQILQGASEKKGGARGDRERTRQLEKAERALDDALKDAGVDPETALATAPDLDNVAPAKQPTTAGAGEAEEPEAPQFSTLSALVRALDSGELDPEFAASKGEEPVGVCTFHGCDTELRLVESSNYRYVLLKCKSHDERTEELLDRVEKCLDQRGFDRKKEHTFRKRGKKSDYNIDVGEDHIRAALRAEPNVLTPGKLPGAVKALGKLLETILKGAVQVEA